jgi:hypothetical protein
MTERLLKDEYKTPRAQVRGVFLCEDVAVPVSVRGVIVQEDWDVSDDAEVGAGASTDGDLVLRY